MLSGRPETFRGQFQSAARIAWLIVSGVLLLTLLIPFVLPHNTILRWTPTCQTKLRGDPPCALCGMTTAFLLISGGRFSDALQSNRASLALYAAFVINTLAAVLYLSQAVKGNRLCRC